MMQRQFLQYFLPLGRQAYVDLSPVIDAAAAANQRPFLQPVDQLDRAVMLNLQALRQVGNACSLFRAYRLGGQHELMLLRLNSCATGSLLAEVQEAPDVVAELG